MIYEFQGDLMDAINSVKDAPEFGEAARKFFELQNIEIECLLNSHLYQEIVTTSIMSNESLSKLYFSLPDLGQVREEDLNHFDFLIKSEIRSIDYYFLPSSAVSLDFQNEVHLNVYVQNNTILCNLFSNDSGTFKYEYRIFHKLGEFLEYYTQSMK